MYMSSTEILDNCLVQKDTCETIGPETLGNNNTAAFIKYHIFTIKCVKRNKKIKHFDLTSSAFFVHFHFSFWYVKSEGSDRNNNKDIIMFQ